MGRKKQNKNQRSQTGRGFQVFRQCSHQSTLLPLASRGGWVSLHRPCVCGQDVEKQEEEGEEEQQGIRKRGKRKRKGDKRGGTRGRKRKRKMKKKKRKRG